MNKTISVIVPIYNSEKYLRKCLMSILNQTYKDIQLICVDDGSQDGSRNIIHTLMKTYKNIDYLYEDNSGPSSARNKGLSLAKGKYVMFVDSDDYITDVNCFSECMQTINDKNISDKRKVIRKQGSFIEFILSNDLWETCGKLVKKECIEKLFNKHSYIGEDLKFWFDNKDSINNYVYIDKQYYHYTQRTDSSMHSKTLRREIIEYFDNLYDIIISINNQEIKEKMTIFYIYSYYSFFNKDANGYIKNKGHLKRIRQMRKIIIKSHDIFDIKKIKAIIKASIIIVYLRLKK